MIGLLFPIFDWPIIMIVPGGLLNEVVFSGQGELTPHIGIMVKTPKPMGF
jgi:hypothetical protein